MRGRACPKTDTYFLLVFQQASKKQKTKNKKSFNNAEDLRSAIEKVLV